MRWSTGNLNSAKCSWACRNPGTCMELVTGQQLCPFPGMTKKALGIHSFITDWMEKEEKCRVVNCLRGHSGKGPTCLQSHTENGRLNNSHWREYWFDRYLILSLTMKKHQRPHAPKSTGFKELVHGCHQANKSTAITLSGQAKLRREGKEMNCWVVTCFNVHVWNRTFETETDIVRQWVKPPVRRGHPISECCFEFPDCCNSSSTPCLGTWDESLSSWVPATHMEVLMEFQVSGCGLLPPWMLQPNRE